MKRNISLLLILALIVSIGGVYATWGYAQGAIGAAEATLVIGEGKNVALAGATSTTSAGTISIDVSDAKILIDDTDNNHIADVSYTGNIVVTFTPSSGADSDVTTNGIPMEISILLGGIGGAAWEYEGTQIFEIAEDFDGNLTGAPMDDGKVTYTFTADEWKEWFIFNGGNQLVLDNMADYNEFHSALHKGSIKLTVSDART